ncbi:MAG: hypothetical protein P4L53_21295 [Candidatus Obscuribacterales bacterium]|nr:hypothetical protein [Candidatus Obscuribacterales bacterium]
MFSNDRLRYIFFGPLPWDVVRSFVGPDAVFYLVGSFLCAWAIKQSAQYRVAALLLMTGGCGYATLLNVGLACTIKTGWVGPCLMLASLVCTVIMAFSHSQREPDK